MPDEHDPTASPARAVTPDNAAADLRVARQPPRFCKACGYDFAGLKVPPYEPNSDPPQPDWALGGPVIPCPECGKPFNPSDPRTYRAKPLMASTRRNVRVGLWTVLVCLALLLAAKETLIPVPAALLPHTRSGNHPLSVWVWLGESYGWYSSPQMLARVRLWASEQVEIQGKKVVNGRIDEDAPPPWQVKRLRDGWRLEVSDPTTDYRRVLTAFNATRDTLLGLRITTDVAGTRKPADRAFVVQGSEDEVISELIRRYGLDVEPSRADRLTGLAWYFDPEQDKLVQITLDEAQALGFAPEPALEPLPSPEVFQGRR